MRLLLMCRVILTFILQHAYLLPNKAKCTLFAGHQGTKKNTCATTSFETGDVGHCDNDMPVVLSISRRGMILVRYRWSEGGVS